MNRLRDRGASVVEVAVVAPVLLLLFVGIVDFGAVYRDYIDVRQGAREGARQISQGKGDNDSYDTASCALSTGDFAAPVPAELQQRDRNVFCMVKDRVGLDGADVRVAIRFEGGTHSVGDATDSLAVCVAYPATSVTGLLSLLLDDQQRVVKSSTQMRVNALFEEMNAEPLGGEWSEAYPYGGNTTTDWSWCEAEAT